jgi:hypothetical protein
VFCREISLIIERDVSQLVFGNLCFVVYSDTITNSYISLHSIFLLIYQLAVNICKLREKAILQTKYTKTESLNICQLAARKKYVNKDKGASTYTWNGIC